LRSCYAFSLLHSLRTHASAFLTVEAGAEVTVAPHWSSKQALTILIGSAVAIGVVSEILVSVTEEAVKMMGLSK
jgi:Ca2+/H+ antiporter